jgi:GDP-L-fucose synthase
LNILLLGHSGFVGSNVAEVLKENKVRFNTGSRVNGVDLRDADGTASFLANTKPDVIINCAANVGSLNYVSESAADVITDNSRMIVGLYEAIARTCPGAVVVNPIANCAYPSEMETFREDEWWKGCPHRSVLPFAATRRLMWAVGESFMQQHGTKTISLLVPNMYGPYDSTDPNKAHALNALISKFVKCRVSRAGEVEVWGSGIAVREWLYAKDFGRIVLQVVTDPERPGLSEPVNIAQNLGLSVRELTGIIKGLARYQGNIRWDTSRQDGALRRVMDDRRFRTLFPEFHFTPLPDGISATVKYYESVFPY